MSTCYNYTKEVLQKFFLREEVQTGYKAQVNSFQNCFFMFGNSPIPHLILWLEQYNFLFHLCFFFGFLTVLVKTPWEFRILQLFKDFGCLNKSTSLKLIFTFYIPINKTFSVINKILFLFLQPISRRRHGRWIWSDGSLRLVHLRLQYVNIFSSLTTLPCSNLLL